MQGFYSPKPTSGELRVLPAEKHRATLCPAEHAFKVTGRGSCAK